MTLTDALTGPPGRYTDIQLDDAWRTLGAAKLAARQACALVPMLTILELMGRAPRDPVNAAHERLRADCAAANARLRNVIGEMMDRQTGGRR